MEKSDSRDHLKHRCQGQSSTPYRNPSMPFYPPAFGYIELVHKLGLLPFYHNQGTSNQSFLRLHYSSHFERGVSRYRTTLSSPSLLWREGVFLKKRLRLSVKKKTLVVFNSEGDLTLTNGISISFRACSGHGIDEIKKRNSFQEDLT